MFVARGFDRPGRASALALSMLGVAVGCGSDDEESTDSRTDEQACQEFCSEVNVFCPTFAGETPGLPDQVACTNGCVAELDSSTAYRRCVADQTNCDGYAACKQKH